MKIDFRSYWYRSGFFTLLERGTLQIFRFLSFFLLVRGMSREEFGIWSLYLVVATFIEMIRVGLIQNGLVRFLSVHQGISSQRVINTASIGLSLMYAGLSVLGLWTAAAVIETYTSLGGLPDLLRVYSVMTVILTGFYQFAFIQQAHLVFQGMFWATLIRHASFFGYVVYIYLNPERPFILTHLVWGQSISAALGTLVAILAGWRYAHFARRLSLVWMRKLWQFGRYVVGTNLGVTLIRTTDQFMLGLLVSPTGVASYSTAMRVAHLVEVPIQSIAAVVFPQSARQMHEAGIPAIRRLYERSVGVILAMVIPGVLFVMLFPGWILEFVAGSRYLDAKPLLQIVMLYALLLPFSRQFGTIMDAIGKPKLQFGLLMSGALLNFCFNYFLIMWIGTVGAAYATILTYSLIIIGSLIILKREIQVHPMNTLYFAGRLYLNGFKLLQTRVKTLARSR